MTSFPCGNGNILVVGKAEQVVGDAVCRDIYDL